MCIECMARTGRLFVCLVSRKLRIFQERMSQKGMQGLWVKTGKALQCKGTVARGM